MWDWRYPLKDLRDEIRKARSEGQEGTRFDRLEALLDQLTDLYAGLEAQQAEETKEKLEQLASRVDDVEQKAATEKIVEIQVKIVTALYDKASAYTNLIIVAGYAAFFGLWSLAKSYLERELALYAAILMLGSATVFVMFEVVKMTNLMFVLRPQQKLLKDGVPDGTPQQFLEALKRAQTSAEIKTKPIELVWPYVLAITVAAALGAIAVLGWALVAALISGEALTPLNQYGG